MRWFVGNDLGEVVKSFVGLALLLPINVLASVCVIQLEAALSLPRLLQSRHEIYQ